MSAFTNAILKSQVIININALWTNEQTKNDMNIVMNCSLLVH